MIEALIYKSINTLRDAILKLSLTDSSVSFFCFISQRPGGDPDVPVAIFSFYLHVLPGVTRTS
jgi:hypothetical protein